jgi:hypothetical protein
VAETERDLADCVGAIYETAANHGSWLDVGTRLCRMFNAPRAMLWIDDRPGGPRNVLMPRDDSESVYAAHFFRIDPYVAQARSDFADARSHHLGRAKVGTELVLERTFLRSEYYNDFARLHGRRHLIGGMAGLTEAAPLGLYRGEGKDPFGERDVQSLQALLPHVQRALELKQRLARDEHAVGLTRALLDALPVGVGVVDAGLKLQFVNDIARNYLASPGVGLCSMRSGPSAGSGVYLAASSREVAAVLRRLVAAATSGSSGGSMRVASRDGAIAAELCGRCKWRGDRRHTEGTGAGGHPTARPEAFAAGRHALRFVRLEPRRGGGRHRPLRWSERRRCRLPTRRLAGDGAQPDPLHTRQVGVRKSARPGTGDGDPCCARSERTLGPDGLFERISLRIISSDDVGPPQGA